MPSIETPPKPPRGQPKKAPEDRLVRGPALMLLPGELERLAVHAEKLELKPGQLARQAVRGLIEELDKNAE